MVAARTVEAVADLAEAAWAEGRPSCPEGETSLTIPVVRVGASGRTALDECTWPT